MTLSTSTPSNETTSAILQTAREQVLERGEGLTTDQALEVLRLPEDSISDALALAHEVRMKWCGPEVEVDQDRWMPRGLPLLFTVRLVHLTCAFGMAQH